jgi:sugar (pentulose or hexulose) kinase
LRLIGQDLGDLGELLLASPPGARGVSALPFLAPSGERAPFADPTARAELTGLTLESTPADVVRAICESLAYAARHCFEAAGLTGAVTVCGGGAANPDLVQLFADILERPLMLSKNNEPAALGAVLAAQRTPPSRAHPGPVVQPRAARYCGDGYADYLYRLDVARQHGWSGRNKRAG